MTGRGVHLHVQNVIESERHFDVLIFERLPSVHFAYLIQARQTGQRSGQKCPPRGLNLLRRTL